METPGLSHKFAMKNYLSLLCSTSLFNGLTPEELQTLLAQLGSVMRSYGKGEALVLLSATDITLADVKNALRKAGISNLWHPKYLVRVDKIPLLPSGKLDLKTIGELAKRTQ